MTGQLGDVMRESVMAAMTLLKSKIPSPSKPDAAETDEALASSTSLSPVPVNESTPTPAMTARSKPGRLPKVLDVEFTLPLISSSSLGLALSNNSSDVCNTPSERVTTQVQTLFSLLDEKSLTLFGSDDVHIHFPAGGIPKDGPSAGVAATLALASLLFGRPVRSDTAVTGEITLRGHVLPVGGIKDKVLAAHRAGIQHVLIPYANMRHAVNDLPSSVAKEIKLHYVKHIDEALHWMFSDDSDGNVAVAPLLSKI